MSNIPFLTNKASIQLLIPSKAGKNPFQSLKLSVGDTITGLVLKSLGKNSALLNIKGQSLPVQTKVPLTPGDSVSLKIETIDSASQKVVMNILPEAKQEAIKPLPLSNLANILRSRLPQKTNLPEVLNKTLTHIADKELPLESVLGKELSSKLTEIIRSITYTNDKSKEEFFDTIVSKSGMKFEAKFKDLLTGTITEKKFIDIIEKDIKGILHKSTTIVENALDKIQLSESEISADGKKIETIQERFFRGLKKDITKALFQSAKKIKEEPAEVQKVLNTTAQVANNKGKLENLLSHLKQFVDNIEIDQVTNYMAKENNGSFYLQIPFLNSDSKIDAARLYIHQQNGKSKGSTGDKGKKGKYYLVFFLNMKKLGNMRIDVTINKNVCNCKFTSKENSAIKFMKPYEPELTNKLQKIGFSPNITFEIDKNVEKTEKQFKKESNMTEMGIIDLVV